jgi:RNA polymerase sigma-B factor
MNVLTAPVESPLQVQAASEEQLWRRFTALRDPSSREALTRRYMPFARRMALRYRNAPEPLDDLVQVANLALLNAIDRFDPERGTSFIAFAAPTILGELKRHFRDRVWTLRVPRRIHDLLGKVEKATAKLTVQLQRSPSPAEIAELLEVDVLDVLEALETSQKRSPFSIDRPLDDDEGSQPAGEWLGGDDPGYDQVDDRLAYQAALPNLDDRQRQVLRLRFVEDLTQTEIAVRIGYSQMQVSRILRGALEQLREDAEESS